MKTTKNKKVVLRQIILHTSHEIHQRSSNFLKMINGVYNFDLFYAHTKKGKKGIRRKKKSCRIFFLPKTSLVKFN